MIENFTGVTDQAVDHVVTTISSSFIPSLFMRAVSRLNLYSVNMCT